MTTAITKAKEISTLEKNDRFEAFEISDKISIKS